MDVFHNTKFCTLLINNPKLPVPTSAQAGFSKSGNDSLLELVLVFQNTEHWPHATLIVYTSCRVQLQQTSCISQIRVNIFPFQQHHVISGCCECYRGLCRWEQEFSASAGEMTQPLD